MPVYPNRATTEEIESAKKIWKGQTQYLKCKAQRKSFKPLISVGKKLFLRSLLIFF